MIKKELFNGNIKESNECTEINNYIKSNIINNEYMNENDGKFLYEKLIEIINCLGNNKKLEEKQINEISLYTEKFQDDKIIINIINYIKSNEEIINSLFKYIIEKLNYENKDIHLKEEILIIKDKIYINIVSIIKIIIVECLIFENDKIIIESETNNNFTIYIFKFLIHSINEFCNTSDKQQKNQLIYKQKLLLLKKVSSIFTLLFNKDENFILLNKQDLNSIFQNMLKIMIRFKDLFISLKVIDNDRSNINKYKNIFDMDYEDEEENNDKEKKNIFDLDYDEEEEEIKENVNEKNNENLINQMIIKYFIKIICILYKKYELTSEELKFIYNNQFQKECLKMIKNYIYNYNLSKYYINCSLILMIDLIDSITIYEFNNKDIKEQIFSLSYMEQLKLNFKDINTMNSFIIKQRIQNTINYIKETNNNISKSKIYRVRYIFNDIEKVRLKLINVINENKIGNNNDERNSIYHNKKLRKCFEYIKFCFFSYFDKIYNIDNNQEKKLLISLDDKKLMIFDIIKIFSFFLTGKGNIKFFIEEKIFEKIIELLNDLNINNDNDYKKYCKEQIFDIFDKITQKLKIVKPEESTDILDVDNKYFLINNKLFLEYILNEYSSIMKLLFVDNSNNYQMLKSFDIKVIKCLSRIICRFNYGFLLKNLELINYNLVYDILNIDELDKEIIFNYIIILKNIIQLSQKEGNEIIITENEKRPLSLLLSKIFIKNFKGIYIKFELMLLIELKIKDENLIKILTDNGLLNKLIELFKDELDTKYNEKYLELSSSKYYYTGIVLINKILMYDYCLKKIINININPIAKRVKENICNIKYCEIYLLIYVKIKKYLGVINKEKNNINLNFSQESIFLIIEIFIRCVNNNNKEIIENALEILSYFIELPSSYSILQLNSYNFFIICLFKSIDIFHNNIYIINYSIKILFRLFSQIKINKENNYVELNLENKEEDLSENIFSEESSDISKIFEDDFFLNFINNNISKVIILYCNENKLKIINNFIELLRILSVLMKSEKNHKNLLDAFINSEEKFINYINNKDIEKNNGFISDKYILDLINHFSFLIYQLISLDKEIIRKDFISLLETINNIINNFYVTHIIIKRYLNIIYIISTYSDKMEINKKMSIIREVFENIKKHKELFSNENNKYNDNQIDLLFLLTKILFVLKNLDLDIINNNIYFILLHLPKSIYLSSQKNKLNYNQNDYNEFKANLSVLCSLYYIKSEKECVDILNYLSYLLNDYISYLNENNQKNNNVKNLLNIEFIFLLRIIKNLCIKTPFMSEEILKKENISSSFMNTIKNYIKKLNIEDSEDNDDKNNELLDEYDECSDIINNEQEYIDIEKEKIILENYKKIYLIGLTIGNHNYEKIKDFLTKKYDVTLYTDDTCFKKSTINVDENLNILYVTTTDNNRIRIDSMKIDSIYKIVNDSSNEAFDINANLKKNHKKCFSLYSKYKKPNKDFMFEKDINIECPNEEFCIKYVKTLNDLVELYNMMKN